MSAPSSASALIARPDAAAPMLVRRGEVLTQADVLAMVEACARELALHEAPDGLRGSDDAGAVVPADAAPQWLNLCLGRQAFMVSFCAVLLRGGVNVLASDPAHGTVARLRQEMPGLRVLGDERGRADLDLWLDAGRWSSARPPGPPPDGTPVTLHASLDGKRIAALPFTSGSTGTPVAHPKRVFATRLTALATEARLFADWPRYSVLATVPSQHMYGLETTLMLALCGRALVACEHPLLPADIARALHAMPRPRVLVTTPVHLRALVRGAATLPAVDRVISATAPLASELAARAEARFGCEVHEIYGCTEAGSLATRRTVAGDVWTLLDGYRITPGAGRGAPDGETEAQAATVHGPQLGEPVTLPDRIECLDGVRFRLLGRRDDMVNIGGKRASLARLNQLLLQVEGVLDGWVYLPADADAGERTRLHGLVVTDGRDARAILQVLAQQMDGVFLPRPLRRVDRIPRNATGKVTQAALQALLAAADSEARTQAGGGDAGVH